MALFKVGSTFTMTFRAYDINGKLMSPTTISLTVVKGSGVTITPTPVESDEGVYQYVATPASNESGFWEWTFSATDGALNNRTVSDRLWVDP